MKAHLKTEAPVTARILARIVAAAPSVFRTRFDPAPSYLPIGDRLAGWRFWFRWLAWSLWRPIDWLLWGEWYEDLTARMVAAPRVTMAGYGNPPPTYRTMCLLLTAATVPDSRIL